MKGRVLSRELLLFTGGYTTVTHTRDVKKRDENNGEEGEENKQESGP